MLSFPTPRKTIDGPWITGPDVEFDPVAVIGIQAHEYRFCVATPQRYTVITLSNEQTIELLVDADTVGQAIEQAKQKLLAAAEKKTA